MANKTTQWWADLLKEFYEDSEVNYSNYTAQNFANDIQNSPAGEEQEMTDEEAQEIGLEVYNILIGNENENKYIVTVFKDFAIDGNEFTDTFKNQSEVLDFLEGIGYDIDDKEVIGLTESGGTYTGLQGAGEFKIDIFKANEKVEIIEEEEEKTAFNDAELFVEEYVDYLIGKEIIFKDDVDTYKYKVVSLKPMSARGFVIIEFDDSDQQLYKKDFQAFIDGEQIDGSESDNGVFRYQLVLQEEKPEKAISKYDNTGNKYYVVNVTTMKILSGHEYKEDAQADLEKNNRYGVEGVLSIQPKKELSKLNINPDNDTEWQLNEHDWAIIESCINAAVERGDYSPKEGAAYIADFKKDGAWVAVIKAALIYCLSSAQKDLKNAFIVSNMEKINDKCDSSCRIQKELKRIIAMEK